VLTEQDKFAEDIVTFVEVLKELQGRRGEDRNEVAIRRMARALPEAKKKQRQARAAILAGHYEEARDQFRAAYKVLEKACPSNSVACAVTVG
jgi:hypothetical protein